MQNCHEQIREFGSSVTLSLLICLFLYLSAFRLCSFLWAMIFHTKLCRYTYTYIYIYIYICSCITTRSNGIQSTSSSCFSTFSHIHSCIFLALILLLPISASFIRVPLFFLLFATFRSFLSAILWSTLSLTFSSDVRYFSLISVIPSSLLPIFSLYVPYICSRQKLKDSERKKKKRWMFF